MGKKHGEGPVQTVKETVISVKAKKPAASKPSKNGGQKTAMKFDANFGARDVGGPSVHGCMSSYNDGDDGHHEGKRSGY